MSGDQANKRVYEQIETTADYYPPTTYAGLLNSYNRLQIEADPASGNFIPLTTSRPSGPTLLFAIGLLPPTANVTGRLLDRTASLPQEAPVGEQAVDGKTASSSTPDGGQAHDPTKEAPKGVMGNIHKAARPQVAEAFKELYGRDPTLAELQYAQAIGWLETSYGTGWKDPMKGSNNWGAVQCGMKTQNNPNCIAYEDSYPDGTRYKIAFRSYETPKDGIKDLLKHIFSYRTTGQSLEGGDVYRASYSMRRQVYYGGFCPKATKEYGASAVNKSVATPDLDAATQACAKEAVTAHANRVKETIDDIAGSNGDPWALGLGTYESADAWWHNTHGADGKPLQADGGAVGGDAAGGNWKDKGSKPAQEAGQQEAKLAGSPLLSSDLGKRLLAAQQATAAATQQALQAMAETPPLAMLINPEKFSVKGDKIVADGNWGRNGPIIEYWGDGQDKISASGRVGGFFAIDVRNATGPGLTRAARNFSLAWENFMSLYQLYRLNGALMLPDEATQRTTGTISMMGSVYIYYDNTLYIGSFDSFNLTETDSSPFTVEYSYEFTVRASFLLDRTDDAFTYGASQFFVKSAPVQSQKPATAVYEPTEI